MKKNYVLLSEFITLGQLLKDVSAIQSGGQAKWYLRENTVFVDGEPEDRRGRKIYAGMMVELPDEGTFFVVKNDGTTPESASDPNEE
ncbi:S4 domain-containing protein YaaA [Enterococcus timonensis]|uniref:S4 domain-containing protein YaaA n=1 Tax=Enterococcus timonensis TaxID=1852364 RepID=UPI0008DAFD85|nr:S4 domain-containing protein YaaA [Enterococcus timonensis]